MQNSSAQNGPKRLKNIALEWSWEATKYTSQATQALQLQKCSSSKSC